MVKNLMKLILLIFSLFIASIAYATGDYNFENEYVKLNKELKKAVINNYVSSRNYDDKNVAISEKLQSKKAWCELNKANLNLIDFIADHYVEYQELMKTNNLDDDSTIEKVKESQLIYKGLYERAKAELKDTEFKCE